MSLTLRGKRLSGRPAAVLTVLLAAAVLIVLPLLGAAGAAGAPVAARIGGWGAPGLAPARAPAGRPAADVMPSFAGEYTLDKDGGVSVTETISYQFDPAQGTRHGIYRSITVRQALEDQPDSYRYYAMSDVSASSPTGANTEVQLTDNGSVMTIKIGSAKVDVSGTQTYVVKYHLANVMNPFTDTQSAEFYYNVFISDSIAKDLVDLQVTAPAAATEVRCGRGSSGSDCDTAVAGQTSRFTVSSLASLENLTIAARYPLGAFTHIAPDIRTGGSPLGETQARAASYAALAGALLVPLLAGVGMAALVVTRGRDEWYAGVTPGLTPGRTADAGTAPVERGRRPTIAVQFNPPPGVQPGLVGTIIDESADTLDVSASVIDLAVRGFLTIEEVDGGGLTKRTDWRLTRLVPSEGEVLRPYESRLLEGLFATSNPVLLSDLKNHFSKTLSGVKDQMYDEVLSRGWFRKSPQRQRGLWLALGFLLVGAGIVLLFFLGALMRGVDRTAGLSLPVSSGLLLGAGVLIAGIVVVVLGRRVPAKTAEGSAVLAQSLGFRQYLDTAEAGQIRWEEAQDIFSRYLPYAIVFGVAERWARTFEQVAAAASAAGQPVLMPTWYIWQGAAFPDFGGIVSGVDSFSSTAAGTFQSTPGSSGGSGFGSSGGTFSGGGIGGSSSGSW
ncbi:MAG: DUF2207 domain-containing protein [Dermatophilaceae bacterium]